MNRTDASTYLQHLHVRHLCTMRNNSQDPSPLITLSTFHCQSHSTCPSSVIKPALSDSHLITFTQVWWFQGPIPRLHQRPLSSETRGEPGERSVLRAWVSAKIIVHICVSLFWPSDIQESVCQREALKERNREAEEKNMEEIRWMGDKTNWLEVVKYQQMGEIQVFHLSFPAYRWQTIPFKHEKD